jgi:hypothetical protein
MTAASLEDLDSPLLALVGRCEDSDDSTAVPKRLLSISPVTSSAIKTPTTDMIPSR